MPLALTLFPEVGTLDMLIEESMPWFMAWTFIVAIALVIGLIAEMIQRIRTRSPVEKLLRRRHVRRSLGEGGFG